MAKVKSNLKTKRKTYVRAWRKFRDLTLEKLAERVGVTAGALSQLERGEVNYTQPMLEALAEELGCAPADLIMRDPKVGAALHLVWNRIPTQDKPKALRMLEAFADTGTEG